MAVIRLQQHEISDVLEVLHQRGLEYAISIESHGAFLYGSDDTIQQVQDILWARQVMPSGADEAGYLAFSCQRLGDIE